VAALPGEADRPLGGVEDSEQTYASLYRLFAENVHDLISLHDDAGAFIYASPSALQLLGFEPAELVGRSVYDLVVEDDLDIVRQAHASIMLREGRQPAVYRARRRDGSIVWLETTARRALDETSGQPRIVAVTRDITERRAFEHQLMQMQKMEALGRLAGGVAHDFNNVLTVIAGHAELLTARLGEGTPERGNAEFIREAAFRAASLTRQLLAFGRGEGRDLQFTDVNGAILDVQPMIARLLGADIALDIELDPRLLAIRCEPAALEQIIINLAVNARDAMPAGGRLALRTANVTLEAGDHASLPAGRYVELTVSDSGSGMTRETAARAFEPFFTTKEGAGSGLGLSTVYSIVRQVRGDVSVESAPGRGARFTLLIPATEHAVTTTGDGRELSGSQLQGTETVLVAEDDPGVRALAVATLQRYGYRVMAAVDGMQALEMFRTYGHLVDVLVTDVNMPELKGTELVRRLVEDGATLPVLYMSGFTAETIPLSDTPRHQFLAKPFTPVELVQSVRALLGIPIR
jgi:two-component system cell cycle sensor histidine kinase/response regulator CckA